MEQAEVDFDEWIKNYKLVEPLFFAVYDPKDGTILGIYPEHAVINSTYKISINTELARRIQENEILLSSCYVDPIQQEFIVLYDKNIVKIDDVLHRIPMITNDSTQHDVYIEYYKQEEKLVVGLTEKYHGTRSATYDFKTKLDEKQVSDICLTITDYNDPNAVMQILKIKIKDLEGKDKIFKNVPLSEKFSIYTRRLFKNYVLKIK